MRDVEYLLRHGRVALAWWWILASGCDWVAPPPVVTEVRMAQADVGLPSPAPVAEVEPVAEAEPVAEPEPPPAPPPKPPPPPPGPRPKNAYQGLLYDIDVARRDLAWRRDQGEDVTEAARAVLHERLPEVMYAWKGTKYSYNGTSTVPKTGKIACGYYVSTILQHFGFKVDRVDLARQPSEQIIRTLVPDARIERFTFASRERVVKRIEQLGEGSYLAGLDTHIGFLNRKAGKPVEFCHSTSRQRKIGVICENAKTSKSFASRYTVIGKLDDDGLVKAWLDGVNLKAARKFQPQPSILIPEPEPLPHLPMGLFEL